MLLRAGRVRVHPNRIEEYEAFERGERVPMVASQDGCVRCGFARVREAHEPVFVSFSVWKEEADLRRAQASEEWKASAQKLQSLGLIEGREIVEHWDFVDFKDGPK